MSPLEQEQDYIQVGFGLKTADNLALQKQYDPEYVIGKDESAPQAASMDTSMKIGQGNDPYEDVRYAPAHEKGETEDKTGGTTPTPTPVAEEDDGNTLVFVIIGI